MRSAIPKPLIEVCGRPMLEWIVDNGRALRPRLIHVVTGPKESKAIAARVAGRNIRHAVQRRPLGTADAVESALDGASPDGTLLILCGDTPLMQAATLRRLAAQAGEGLALLTADLDAPKGYGRIIGHRPGMAVRIVEERDATPAERAVRKVYAGAMAAPAQLFRELLPQVRRSPKTRERYLTELVRLAAERRIPIRCVTAPDVRECLGVNSPADLERAARAMEMLQAERLLAKGVRLLDASSLRIRGTLRCGRDVEIDANVVFEGGVTLGANVRIRSNCVLRNVSIGANTVIHPFTHLADCRIGSGCSIGPFARMRDGAGIDSDAFIGNFVEVKKSRVRKRAKASHLSYIGDADVGAGTNIGAGVITCNFDGRRKHKTVIGDRAFVGSGVELVAPLRIGSDALVGAGSTLTRDVPKGELSLARACQTNMPRKRGKRSPG